MQLMNKMIKAGLVLTLSLSSIIALAVPLAFVEGDQYEATEQRLSVSDDQRAEVVELFMYTCPHCYHLEPEVHDWLAAMDENDKVNFRLVPAVFSEKQEPLAAAFYAAEALALSDKLHPLFFEAIHEDGLNISTEKAILNYVAEQGVDRASFEMMMASFAVKAKVRKAEALTDMSGIKGVPSMVVNGRYHTNGPMAGSVPAIFDVVDFLVNKTQE
jgi:thiol:disulfide interchange protein DsbA